MKSDIKKRINSSDSESSENDEYFEQLKKIKFKKSNHNNVMHTKIDLERLNKNKCNDPYTKKLINEDKMLLFITLTQKCQLNCKYCGNGENVEIEETAPQPPEIEYDIGLLKKFNKVKELAVCFYGGEPLLRIPYIEKIMPMLPNAKFVLQTNGINLKMLKPQIVRNFDTILVSIDGDEDTTDYNRGKGTYKTVINNVKWIREACKFEGDLIARMTVTGNNDIYKSVMHLLNVGLFDHVHWQLDVEWDSDMDARYTNDMAEGFIDWKDKIYNPGISKLMKEFIINLKEGRILGIVPFLGLIKIFIKGEKVKRILCGSGSDSFNVTTGGLINCCPIAAEIDPIDDLRRSDFDHKKLYDTELIAGFCKECEILDKCGGRCLYANKDNWWGEEGRKAVCQTVFHLIKTIEDNLVQIKELIEGKEELLDKINYPKYNNTTEIIP